MIRFLYSFLCVLVSISKEAYGQQEALSGMYSPVFTPFNTSSGEIDLSVIPEYAQFLKDGGTDGVSVATLTGEGLSLSVDEKKKLYEAWVNAARPLGLKIIVQVGGIPVPDIIELTHYAVNISVDGIQLLPPPYYIITNSDEFVALLEIVAENAGDLPIYYDDFYEYTLEEEDDFSLQSYFDSASRRVAQFKGMVGTFRVAVYASLENDPRSDQTIFIYNQPNVEAAAFMDCNSFMLPAMNIFPSLFKQIVDLSSNGTRSEEALAIQDRLNDIVYEILDKGDDVATLKAAAELVSGIKLGGVRPPMRALSRTTYMEIKDILEDNDVETHD